MKRVKTILALLFWTTVVGVVFAGGSTFGSETLKRDNRGSPGDNQQYSKVCLRVSDMVREGRKIGTKAEKELGKYGNLKPVLQQYRFTENAMSILREIKGYVVSLSTIDIDNDGVRELRFRLSGGSGHCEDNYFFKKDGTGTYGYVEAKGLDLTGGRLCADGGLSFFRHKGLNYLAVHSSPLTFPQKIDLYSGRKDGFRYECTIQTFSDQVDASTTCKEAICEAVRRKAQDFVTGALGGQVFSAAEQPIEDSALLAIDWHSLKPFEREGQLFSIDLDNDGVDELMIKRRSSPANWLHYSILRMEAGTYRVIDPRNFYENYEVLGEPDDYLFDDNLVFVKSSDKNYFITIHFNHRHPKSCHLGIYLIEKRKASKIGIVNASFKKLKNNLSHDEN